MSRDGWINSQIVRGMLIAMLVIATLAVAYPVHASWYALLVGAQGQDQATFAGDITAVNGALTSGRWRGYNVAGHTLVLSSAAANQASNANVVANLQAIN